MNKLDLHIHSHHSADGELSVHEILDICRNQEMRTIAITDHNSIAGLEAAVTYGKQLGLEVIPGIEIDCVYQSVNLHLLGYYVDCHAKGFKELEEDLFTQEMDAFPIMIRNLREIGIMADGDEILKKADGKAPCGELIAEVLLNGGDCRNNALLSLYLKGGSRSDMPYLNFYRDFFAQGKIAHVAMQYMPLEAAIELIKKSGGVPVIAHPGDNLKHSLELIDNIIAEGVMGIEVFSNYHSPEHVAYFLKKAEVHHALITCGSDFHGKNKPLIRIGDCNCNLDEIGLLDALRKAGTR